MTVLAPYSNKVECRGQLKPWGSCRDLLENMRASTDQVVFGVDVQLPNKTLSGKFSYRWIPCMVADTPICRG